MAKSPRSLSIATILEIVAAVALGVPVIRYALAFQAAEPPLNVWGWQMDVSPITGLLFGLTYEGAVYLGIREAFRAWRDGLKRWWLPLPGVALQILAGIAIIAPVVEATQSHQELSAVLGAWSWPWSIVLTGATALTLVSLAVTRTLRKDVPATETHGKHTETHAPKLQNAQRNENEVAASTETEPHNGNGKHPHEWRQLAVQLHELHPEWTRRQIAQSCGVHPSQVSRVLKVANATED